MSDVAVVSRSDAAKGPVLARIMEIGGVVGGECIADIWECLDIDVSRRTLRSALWKLVQDGKLAFRAQRSDWESCDPRCHPAIEYRTYMVRA